MAVYTAYPAVMVAAGTPQGQEILIGIVEGLAPGPPTDAPGVGVSIMKDAILTFFE